MPSYEIDGKLTPTWASSREPSLARRRHRALLRAGGGILATVLVAAVARAGDSTSSPTTEKAATASRQGVGHVDPLINVQSVTYEPDQVSGWHRHAGTHVVAVVHGALTVLDESCGGTVYGPGEAYLGGKDPHLAVNRSNEPVRFVVTNIADPLSGFRTVPIDAPTCPQPAPENGVHAELPTPGHRMGAAKIAGRQARPASSISEQNTVHSKGGHGETT